MLHCFSLNPAESAGWVTIKQTHNIQVSSHSSMSHKNCSYHLYLIPTEFKQVISSFLAWSAYKNLLCLWTCKFFQALVCTITYPVCNGGEPCCHLWSVRFYNTSTLSNKWDEFLKENVLNIKSVFCFSQQHSIWIYSYSKKNWARYGAKMYLGLHVS